MGDGRSEMSAPKCFEDLEAWQAARELTNRMYTICRQGPLARDFALRDQLQRAAVSAMSNIAEGFESRHLAEKQQAYNYARRSCGEVRSLNCVLADNGFVTSDQQREIMEHVHSHGQAGERSNALA